MIVHMIGNAHIDPVWLWPWQAGVDEVLATFGSAIDRCNEYPDFVFTRGEAWCYRVVERLDPAMFREVRRLVASGQWHITGGQWMQPDVNLPTLAGLHRQFIHGKRYFQEKFGVSPDVGYNVDSFGHPATLPDVLAAHGHIGYVFHRPSQEQTPVPAATFRWRGVGGSEVLGYRIPAPYTTRSDDLYGQIMLSIDAANPGLDHVMCFYGVGNHGGGPTKGNIEYILNNRHAFAGAELRFSTPQEFFRAAAKDRDQLPVVEYELQKVFPGCYVVMQDVKREQRRGEHLLGQAEAAIHRFAEPSEKPELTQKLNDAWEDLLFTQFHDILAGTSIDGAWPAVHAMQGRARIGAEEMITHVTRRWARSKLPKVNFQQIAVLNPGPGDFDGMIEHAAFIDFAAWGDRWISDGDGVPVPFQHVQAQTTILLTPAIVFPAKVAAGEAAVYLLREDAKPNAVATPNRLTATQNSLANERVSVHLSSSGIDRVTIDGRDLLGSGGLSLRLREDPADTWGFHVNRFAGEIVATLSNCEWVVEETGPLRARVRCETVIGRSPLRLTLSLHAGSATVEIELHVTYSERFKLLQMPISLPVPASVWRAGLAGGAVDRETGPIEWPLHGWASASGLAVLSPDANSASCENDVMTWSLLRAPRMAWGGVDASIYAGRHDFTDQGLRRFAFELSSSMDDAELTGRTVSLCQPPVVIDRYEGMDRPPWGNQTPRRFWTAAEHRARRDGRMMHLQDDGSAAVEE